MPASRRILNSLAGSFIFGSCAHAKMLTVDGLEIYKFSWEKTKQELARRAAFDFACRVESRVPDVSVVQGHLHRSGGGGRDGLWQARCIRSHRCAGGRGSLGAHGCGGVGGRVGVGHKRPGCRRRSACACDQRQLVLPVVLPHLGVLPGCLTGFAPGAMPEHQAPGLPAAPLLDPPLQGSELSG